MWLYTISQTRSKEPRVKRTGSERGVISQMMSKKFPPYRNLIIRIHALRQMFQRNISGTDVRTLLVSGHIIEEYRDDTPYPSCLVSGTVQGRPLHLVMAYNNVDGIAIVITAYEPDPDLWSDNFSRRRS